MPLRIHCLLSLATLGCLATLCLLVPDASGQPRRRGINDANPPAQDQPELAENLAKRESSQDRATAMAEYTQGRMLLQRRDFGGALRKYQRAWRYRPGLVSIMSDILPLALSLDREQEATRYAILAAENGQTDDNLTQRMAALLAEREDWGRAIKLYEQLLPNAEKPPQDMEQFAAQLELGRLYLITDQFEPAARVLGAIKSVMDNPGGFGLRDEEINDALPRKDLVRTLIAEAMLRGGKLTAARDAFTKRFPRPEDQPHLAYHLARIALAERRLDDARQLLHQYFRSKDQQAGLAAYQLLEELIAAEYAELSEDQLASLQRYALIELGDWRQDDPAFPQALGLAHYRADQWKDAIKVLRPLSEEDELSVIPALVDCYVKTGQSQPLLSILARLASEVGTLSVLDDSLEELLASEDLIEAMKSNAQSKADEAGVAATMAYLLLQTKDYEAAQSWFEKSLIDNEDAAAARVRWGIDLLLAGQSKQAAEALKAAVNENPWERRAEIYSYLADAYQEAGDPERALQAVRRAAALESESAYRTTREGYLLFRQGKPAEAVAVLEPALKRFEEDYDAENRQELREIRMALSSIYLDLDRYDDAVRMLEEVLDEFPNDIGALNDLGYIWADHGEQLQRALRMTQRAVAAEPENTSYLDSLGWAYYRLGRFEEAAQQMEKAVADESADAVVLDHMGDVYAALDRQEDARRYWQLALDKVQDNPELKAALQQKLEPPK